MSDISIIIPHRNHQHSLPRALDSILAQQGISPEVILVDDNSDESCTPLLDAYRTKGLNIKFLPHDQRIYTRQARLEGIQATQSNLITFVDADDALVGTEVLAKHIARMQNESADVLHFRSYIDSIEKGFIRYFSVADPFSEYAKGQEIFKQALREDMGDTSVLWNKLYRKEIFMKFLDHAKKSKVRRYSEDLYLVSLYYMYAQSYIGSHEVGYAYSYEEKNRKEAAERASYAYYMIEELVPLLEKLNFSYDVQKLFTYCLQYYITICIGRLTIALEQNQEYQNDLGISDKSIQEILANVDEKTLLKILLIANRINAKKIIQATKILQTKRIV